MEESFVDLRGEYENFLRGEVRRHCVLPCCDGATLLNCTMLTRSPDICLNTNAEIQFDGTHYDGH